MGLRPIQGNEKRLGPASALYGIVTLSLSSRPKRTRISCHAALETTACAAFSKESRMKFANATNTDRKFGEAERRDLRFLFRFPHTLTYDHFSDALHQLEVDSCTQEHISGRVRGA
jgi:hypothetical protein